MALKSEVATMKTLYVNSNVLENMKHNNLLHESPIPAQTVANGLNERFDTDEFVVVTVGITNTDIQCGYTVVSTTTM